MPLVWLSDLRLGSGSGVSEMGRLSPVIVLVVVVIGGGVVIDDDKKESHSM